MLMSDKKMPPAKKRLKDEAWFAVYIVIVALLSIIFGLMFFFSVVDSYGVGLSLFWTLTGILVLWIILLLKGYIIKSFISKKNKQR